MTTPDLLKAARSYARRGWTAIPVKGKQAACRWTRWQTGRPDDAQLAAWFGRSDVTGVALICGAATAGLCVRDFDDRASFDRWRADHADLARVLPQVETHRGGHVYFTHGREVFAEFDDGELRGDNRHYVVAPPSRHPSGAVYRWVVPLPDGPLPVIADLAGAGLVSSGFPPDTETAETPETTSGVSALSALSVSQAVENAVVLALPKTAGQRNRSLFRLAQALRAIPEFAAADVGAVRDIVRQWHERALPVIETKSFVDSWADFARGWGKVKFPLGAGPLADIAARARAADPPPEAVQYDLPEARALVALCRELQRTAGDGPFFIAARTAGPLIGTDWRTAARYLSMLVADRILIVTESHTPTRATRYRYLHGDK